MIRIVWGTGAAATPMASFDAALADAGVHQYNLRRLSSVIPADATLDRTAVAPDLGPTGHALDVVQARQTSSPDAQAAAGLAWARHDDGTGIFYEDSDHDPKTVKQRLLAGIGQGCDIRGIDPDAVEIELVSAEPTPEQYTSAVCLAIYGEATRIH